MKTCEGTKKLPECTENTMIKNSIVTVIGWGWGNSKGPPVVRGPEGGISDSQTASSFALSKRSTYIASGLAGAT